LRLQIRLLKFLLSYTLLTYFKNFLAHAFFPFCFLNPPSLVPFSVVPILHIPEFILYTFYSYLIPFLFVKTLSSSVIYVPFRWRRCILYCWHRLLQYSLMCAYSVPQLTTQWLFSVVMRNSELFFLLIIY
jgi:hypothetical protein